MSSSSLTNSWPVVRRDRQRVLLRLLLALTALVALSWALLRPGAPAQAVSASLVISQFQVAGATAADEFVELHNVGPVPYNLSGHRLVYRSAAGTADVELYAWGADAVVPAGGFYLLAAAVAGSPPGGYDGTETPDVTFAHGGTGRLAAAAGGLALRSGALNTGTILDSVGYGSATNAFVEGAPISAPAPDTGRVRKGVGCQDTDHNGNDFEASSPSAPRGATASPVLCGTGDATPTPTPTPPVPGSETPTTTPTVTLTPLPGPSSSPTLTATATVTGTPGTAPSGGEVVISQVYGGGALPPAAPRTRTTMSSCITAAPRP